MFAQTDHAVVNLDADFADRILEAAKAAGDVTTFSQRMRGQTILRTISGKTAMRRSFPCAPKTGRKITS